MRATRTRLVIVAYVLGILGIHGVVLWNARSLIRKGYADFTIDYCAGTMVRDGLGHQLYDLRAQNEVKHRFAPSVAVHPGELPYNHPPFEALFFLPFSYAPYLTAFVLWDLLNLGLLLAIAFLLRDCFAGVPSDSWKFFLPVSLVFFPVFFNLLQGQDSIALALLYAVAFVCLRKNREIAAGAGLALGLFKPQLIVPFVVLWVVRGHRRLLLGFLPTAAVLLLISVGIVGWTGFMAYPHSVLSMEDAFVRGGILPADMPNLDGALYLLMHGSTAVGPATIAISGILFLWVAGQCRIAASELFDLQFALALVLTVLVSYHCLGYDLCLLIVPILVVLVELRTNAWKGWPGSFVIAALLFLFSPFPLLLLMRGNHFALVGWAVVLLMMGLSWQIWLRMRSSRDEGRRLRLDPLSRH